MNKIILSVITMFLLGCSGEDKKVSTSIDNQTKEIIISEDVLFNRSKSSYYDNWFSQKLRENKEFMLKYTKFINNYSEDIRYVAKIMLATYKEFRKGK